MKVLESEGVGLLSDGDLDHFMERHRIRYVGGLDKQTAEAFKEETGVDAVLVTSLTRYDPIYPPKIALFSRLVSTEENPAILWMDSVGISGDDSPGILGLGLIGDPRVVAERAVSVIAKSLERYLSTGNRDMIPEASHKAPAVPGVKESPAGRFGFVPATVPRPRGGRFGPKVLYQSPKLGPENRYRVAVLPFQNFSPRKNAGEIVALHFVRQFSRLANVSIVEPGVVRQTMLERRIIMRGGISLSDVELLSGYPEIDLVVTGTVFTYQDYAGPGGTSGGTPKVDFSVQVIEKKSGEVLWASDSYNRGDDGVFFFDAGRVSTAITMASEMVGATVADMMSQQNYYAR
jgi:TolB-like protein